MTQLNLKIVDIALERAPSSDFEKFANAFCPAIFGVDFVPTGGTHDGGADAFQDAGLYSGARPGTFYQVSTQEDHRAKIRSTVARLKEFGRDPKTLVYITSRPIVTPDAEDEKLSAELDVTVKIRDRRWVVANINTTPAGAAAFTTYLAPHVAFIHEAGGASLLSKSEYIPSRSVCVFLGQEVDRRRKNSELLDSIADSLILWSLNDTNPDTGKFRTRLEILEAIERAFPPARKFIRGVIDSRLAELSSKTNTQGREIRWYAKEQKACLPHETRKLIEEENIEDEFLKTNVLESFELAAASILGPVGDPKPTAAEVARVAVSAIERAFINNGLEIAAFLKEGGSAGASPAVSDDVDVAMDLAGIAPGVRPVLKDVALRLLRKAFYESTDEQRTFLGKLSRTYALLFSLQADERIVEYFQHMSANFILFVGSDIFVRALAEQYLPEKDQMTCNLVKVLKAAGATLYLCDPVLDEIHRHLETTDWEFANFCAPQERHFDLNIARHIGKILIRAYFYAKLAPAAGVRPPANWEAFIGQFCDYRTLHTPATGKRQLQQYLVRRFGLEVLTEEELAKLVVEEECAALAKSLEPYKRDKGKEVLALNDARMILAVYGMRRQRREAFKGSAYGFSTWWLTHETKVQLATADLVRSRGAKYILRPDFVLNFIALSPTTQQVRTSYETIMPSLLGVQLSNRMRLDIFQDVMTRVEEAAAVDDARAQVMMGELSNRLKGDFFKQYEVEWAGASR